MSISQNAIRVDTVRRASALVSGVAALLLAGATPADAVAQQSATAATPLVFDGVTVVDVEQGKLIPAQRVVITGNRIQAVGSASAVTIPKKAQVVDARGKYLIPGLWDMHVHVAGFDRFGNSYHPLPTYPLFIAHGVTGFRDAGEQIVPFDSLIPWRQRVLAGTLIGPPRQLFSAPALFTDPETANHSTDTAYARRYADSLKKLGQI